MPHLQEIRQNLWLYEVEYPDFSVRGALVMGERYAAVWDSLAHPSDVIALSDVLGDKPFHLVYSHADWDHCWGTSGFTRAPAAIVGHAECRRRFDDDVPATLSRMQLAEAGRWEKVRLVPPNLSFSTTLSLDLGGLTLELRHLPGHAPDCIVGWIPEWSLLLGGDAIETPLPVVNHAEDIDSWLAGLEAWAARDDLLQTIPSHGSYSGRAALTGTIAYLRALSGDRNFDLPPALDTFYAEAHQKNLATVDGKLDEND